MKLYVGDSLVYQEIVGGDILISKQNMQRKLQEVKNLQNLHTHTSPYINGKVFRDATWTDCEKRVKGVKG